MPVDTPRKEYKEFLDRWSRCRDVFDGGDSVKRRGQAYLPKLGGQDEDGYSAYVKRAEFYNGMERTVQGLSGTVFRKDPSVKVPKLIEEEFKDVTLSNAPLTQFGLQLFIELLVVGRQGVLLDMPTAETIQQTPERYRNKNRPYWVPYKAEQIVNWDIDVKDGQTRTTMVVLKECIDERDPSDPFVKKEIEQYRVLELVNNQYTVQLWRKNPDKQNEFIKYGELVVPKYRGEALDYIPFWCFNPDGLGFHPRKPPLQDLVDINLSHYRSSADLEHGAHFTALPTPWVAGASGENVLRIGSGVAWKFSDPNAKAGMLEYTGQGLQALEKRCDAKEKKMAILGARILESRPTVQEAAETVAMRHAGEQSVLATMADIVSLGLTQIAKRHAEWSGAANIESIEVKLNKDFFDTKLTPAELAELVRSWQAGAFSYATLYHNLKKGELTRPGVEAEQEKQEADAEAPEDEDIDPATLLEDPSNAPPPKGK